MTKRPFIHLMLWIHLLLTAGLAGQAVFNLESELLRLDSLDVQAYRLAVDTLHFKLTRINDTGLKRALTERVFEFTETRDPIAHIRSLVYPVVYNDSLRTLYLRRAFVIARKYNSRKELAWLEERRCRYHMEKGRYDSAMVSLLRLRDEYTPSPDSDDCLNIDHLMGDIYFRSGLFEQARNVYRSVLERYEANENWDFWRPYVIMNNLGLIAISMQQYERADRRFHQALVRAEKYLTIPEKMNIMAFSLVKLMEIGIKCSRPDVARHYLAQVEAIPASHIYADVRQELLFWKSQLYLEQGDASGALMLANELDAYSANLPIVKFTAEINLLMSQIYKALDEASMSLHYLEKYNAITDSLDMQQQLTRSLLLMAEKDHQFTLDRLQATRQSRFYLAVILGLLMAAFLVAAVLYRRLYHSKLALVNKALEHDFAEDRTPALRKSDRDLPDEAQLKEMSSLARELQKLVSEEKIYLDADLTLQKTAGYLSTNRTYLSTAVNHIFHMNFPSYINRLRIQESIRLIADGLADRQTLESLAKQSGFSNRTVFITAFKKVTGVPPSFFIKNYDATSHESQDD